MPQTDADHLSEEAAELIDDIRRKTGRIEAHLETLATSDELPVYALGICLLRIE